VTTFVAVNLHPRLMLSFAEWCKQIASFMMASDSFDLITQSNINKYHLLPVFWQAMTPERKGGAVSIFKKHNLT